MDVVDETLLTNQHDVLLLLRCTLPKPSNNSQLGVPGCTGNAQTTTCRNKYSVFLVSNQLRGRQIGACVKDSVCAKNPEIPWNTHVVIHRATLLWTTAMADRARFCTYMSLGLLMGVVGWGW